MTQHEAKRWMQIIGVGVGIVGYGIVWYAAGWLASLGVWLAVAGATFEHLACRHGGGR